MRQRWGLRLWAWGAGVRACGRTGGGLREASKRGSYKAGLRRKVPPEPLVVRRESDGCPRFSGRSGSGRCAERPVSALNGAGPPVRGRKFPMARGFFRHLRSAA
ncbi:hypothetical protein GCM10023074_51950 [Microbispora amethystogenes]|uniref:Uncharacterized protein n=1 Tax=Microbispora amethystogenes TaxID=1427754 RepID=A0ABQ4FGU3_9ACTN|nr:hypothetical protein Mam01_42040 [Microbispora amethystogenes]